MSKFSFSLLFLVLTCSTTNPLAAQEYFRFRADFSIKEKIVGDTQGQLILGVVYYDKSVHKVNHFIRFPEKEAWLIQDTTMYRVVNDSLKSKSTIPPFGEFSMYNMILSQQLTDFGLAKGGYILANVEESGNGKTTSTWEPKEQLKAYLGKVIILQEQKRVSGVAFYDKEGLLQGKFYFQDYQIMEGLPVPTKILQKLFLPEKKEFNRIITFTNVIINQDSEDEKYDFRLPDQQ